MYLSIDSMFITVISFFLIPAVSAYYDSQARTNVATYYGQGPNQKDLKIFCQKSDIDLIPLAFVTAFPAQADGYVSTNFGNQCGGAVYSGPGYNGIVNHAQDGLLSSCSNMAMAIPVCQGMGKKILLSLGGATSVTLVGAQDGEYLADFLWGAFGPSDPKWVSQGKPRPFGDVSVDGFDFDIENPSSDNQAGYVACINRLRYHFQGASKQFLITGAPQCVIPDANMGVMIQQAQFDIIWVQFYNTPFCSARAWINTGGGFSYDGWASFLVGTASANAKLYIGLPGSTLGAGDPSNYLNPTEMKTLLKAFYCHANFGGVMLWDATYSDNNINSGMPYYSTVKSLLVADSQDPYLPCRNGTGIVSPGPVATTTSAAAGVATAPSSISSDGTCGPGKMCGISFPCCSQYGYCGNGPDWCGTGCQSAFGICSANLVASSKSTALKMSFTVKTSTISKLVTTVKVSSSRKTSMTFKTSTTKHTISTPAAALKISTDGTCGAGTTCKGVQQGQCCSKFGYCGSGPSWCGTGCQPAFGICS